MTSPFSLHGNSYFDKTSALFRCRADSSSFFFDFFSFCTGSKSSESACLRRDPSASSLCLCVTFYDEGGTTVSFMLSVVSRPWLTNLVSVGRCGDWGGGLGFSMRPRYCTSSSCDTDTGFGSRTLPFVFFLGVSFVGHSGASVLSTMYFIFFFFPPLSTSWVHRLGGGSISAPTLP